MTQYRLKKDTFGIPAGTIAERRGAEDYIFRYDCHDYWVSVPRFMVEQSSDFENVEEPKKLARATFFYDNACEEPTNPTALFSSYDEACEHASCYSNKVVKIIWPARFDDEGYLIMEDDDI